MRRSSGQRPRPPAPAAWPLTTILLALAGCAGPAPRDTIPSSPAEIPARWLQQDASSSNIGSNAADAAALAQWWRLFEDAELSHLIETALRANTSIRGAEAALRQARALRDVSAAGLLPALSGSASAQRSRSGQSSSSASYKAGFDASWEPDLFGANSAAVDTAEASARASAASLADVRVSVAAEVALAYITLRGSQQRLAIAQANLDSQLETLQITQWRLQAGLTTSLEAEQARASVEQTRATLPNLQTSLAQAGHALAALTGQTAQALVPLSQNSAAVPQPRQDLTLAIPADTLRQRPDVRAAEASLAAALSKTRQADAARKPSLRLSGTLGLGAGSLSGLSDSSALLRTLLASIALPIFDGGALNAQLRAAQAAAEQSRTAYEASILTALLEVEDALVALRGDRARLARLQLASEAAANAALLARQRYGSGLVDFQTVLETQRTLLNTQDGVASAAASVSADHVRLYKALGGGWQPETSAAGSTSQAPALPAPNSDSRS
ncbi:MAG: RND transporter [Methylibium sp.]|nr:RND transporter [Methylibium sp.]